MVPVSATIRRVAVAPVKPLPVPPVTHKRIDLFNSMANGTEVTIMSRPDGKYHTGIVQQITREDGSGYSFLVRLHNSPTVHYLRVM
jgi:hypothetical protein